jgi:hypothetical protein
VHGEIEKEDKEQGLIIRMSLHLHSPFKEFCRHLETASQRTKFRHSGPNFLVQFGIDLSQEKRRLLWYMKIYHESSKKF